MTCPNVQHSLCRAPDCQQHSGSCTRDLSVHDILQGLLDAPELVLALQAGAACVTGWLSQDGCHRMAGAEGPVSEASTSF